MNKPVEHTSCIKAIGDAIIVGLIGVGILMALMVSSYTASAEPTRLCIAESAGMPAVSIDGRKRDLLTFTFKGKTYTDTVRDGDYLLCNLTAIDVIHVEYNSNKKPDPVTGVTPYVMPSTKEVKVGGDITTNGKVVALRHGRKRDLLRLYGILRDSNGNPIGVSQINFAPRDGRDTWVNSESGDIIHRYGNERDLYTRFCFDGARWTRSPGNARGLGRPSGCSVPVVEANNLAVIGQKFW